MPSRTPVAAIALLVLAAPVAAQQVRMIKEGIYVVAAKEADSNVNIILTQDGPVLIDTGQTVADARAAMDLVKKFTPQPVRYVLHTEPHADHTVRDFVFSPPAVVVAAAGAAHATRRHKPPA